MEKVVALVGFLACPSDVTDYREKAKETFFYWNIHNSLDKKVFLLPINWEDNARPDSGDSPQELIDRQLLKQCDFLIGIFWQRLGTPTEKAESGTVNEINNFMKSGKTCMIYFSDQLTKPSLIDTDEQIRLKEFKRKIGENTLYKEISSLDEFQSQLNADLSKLVSDFKNLGDEDMFNSSRSAENMNINFDEISNEAKKLLISACQEEGHPISVIKYLGGCRFQSGELSIKYNHNEIREIAKWEEAIDQLLHMKLIKAMGNEPGFYTPTKKGFDIASVLKVD